MEETQSDILEYHKPLVERLDFFYKSKKIPHIIFHGSSGCGKRTILNHFINKIYNNDKRIIKANVMYVNCAHGKGIKFIREKLKFFAKTNILSNNGVLFKSIILMNADYLTIDAQSALRRCIELFSYNTRFFITLENKQKLMNPILSRFCEIYIPEYTVNGEVSNFHQHYIKKAIPTVRLESNVLDDEMTKLYREEVVQHSDLISVSERLYEGGINCVDLISWIKKTDLIEDKNKSTYELEFNIIRSEFRCERLLIFYILNNIFLRSENDIKSIIGI
jgi:DNA polymerase III delta prime subunit|tara:strand:+ start:1521 stop:2351 length:831 start_codon:yes stop_codon:yes gene_type:complete